MAIMPRINPPQPDISRERSVSSSTIVFRRILALLLCLLTAGIVSAQEEEAAPVSPIDDSIREFEVSLAASAIRVDGILDEDAWKDATVIDLPVEWFPGDNAAPPVETECLVTYSKSTLYVGFRAFDPKPNEIRAHLMDRDAIRTFIQDDHVGVMIDTFNDERRAFQFRVNPLSVQVDASFDDFAGTEDFAWDAIWSSRARITDEGYIVEMAIPLNQLRFPRGQEVQTWGFEAFRNYPRADRHRITSRYTDRNKECTLCMQNKVTGFQGLSPGLNLEVNPTATGIMTEARDGFPDGDFQTEREEEELGLDIRWGLTNNLALNATYNPDFSQVEADTAQLDVNTRFALFFPEQRPFFLEGANIFDTPINAVFTRTVADPNYGIKLTGKEGKNAIGVFFTEDDQNNTLIPFNQGSAFAFSDDKVDTAVLRYRRDVGQRSAIGVLYTGRESKDYHNRVAGLDGVLRIDTSNSIRFQWLRSDTLYQPDISAALGIPFESFEGDALNVSYLHISRNWIANLQHESFDENFRADTGFVPRIDTDSTTLRLDRRKWGTRETWYRRLTFGFNGEYNENGDGIVTEEGARVRVAVDGPLQSFVQLSHEVKDEFFAGTTYDLGITELQFQVKPKGGLVALGVFRVGDAIDFTNGQAADETFINPGIDIRLGDHINWLLDYQVQTLDVAGGELFEAQLAQSTFLYQFNTRSFVRAIFQYTDVTRDPDLHFRPVNDRTKDLFTQLLFSYRLNARTVLFTGYTDNRFGLDRGPLNISLTQEDRTFFLKVGYAFLF